MTTPYIGQIFNVGFNFAPRGYATCDGQILPIQQNTALFSLLGTFYGGNGTTNFALPNMQGRSHFHNGQGPGLSNYTIGQQGGAESRTLLLTNLPSHTHATTFTPTTVALSANAVNGTTNTPTAGTGLALAIDGDTMPDADPFIYVPAGGGTQVALGGTVNLAGTIATDLTGGTTPVPLAQPYLTILTIIATQGIFPSRN